MTTLGVAFASVLVAVAVLSGCNVTVAHVAIELIVIAGLLVIIALGFWMADKTSDAVQKKQIKKNNEYLRSIRYTDVRARR